MKLTVTFPIEAYNLSLQQWQKDELYDHCYRATHPRTGGPLQVIFHIRETDKFGFRRGDS